MDVKSTFLNGFINKEVYDAQPPGFIDHIFSNCVFKLKKALYCLRQAHRAWYDHLKVHLILNDFKIGAMDSTLFIKTSSNDIFTV